MEPKHLIAEVEKARKKTLLLLTAGSILMVIFTMAKGRSSIWSEFDREQNAWTFWKASIMMLTAAVAYVNYLLAAVRREQGSSRPSWPWVVLALAFVFLAFDDMLILHERGGHAIERAVPLVSRQHIVIYMDDLLELAYAGAAFLYGALFLRGLMPDRSTFHCYNYGVAALVIATAIGLPPAVKSQPFPIAVIQFLHLVSICLLFTSLINCAAAEVIWHAGAGPPRPRASDEGIDSRKAELRRRK